MKKNEILDFFFEDPLENENYEAGEERRYYGTCSVCERRYEIEAVAYLIGTVSISLCSDCEIDAIAEEQERLGIDWY